MNHNRRAFTLYTADLGVPLPDDVLSRVAPERAALAMRTPSEKVRRQTLWAGLLLADCLGLHDDLPRVRGKPTAPGLHFSLSHGGGFAVLAVAACPVGVDVEPLRRLNPAVVRRYFREPCDTDSDFTRIWTAKEAIFKATGQPLAAAIDTAAYNLTVEPFADGWLSVCLDG